MFATGQNVGVLFSLLLAGWAVDTLGDRTVLVLGGLLTGLLTLAVCLAPTFLWVLVLPAIAAAAGWRPALAAAGAARAGALLCLVLYRRPGPRPGAGPAGMAAAAVTLRNHGFLVSGERPGRGGRREGGLGGCERPPVPRQPQAGAGPGQCPLRPDGPGPGLTAPQRARCVQGVNARPQGLPQPPRWKAKVSLTLVYAVHGHPAWARGACRQSDLYGRLAVAPSGHG